MKLHQSCGSVGVAGGPDRVNFRSSSVRFVGFVLASQVTCRLLEIQLSETPWASETADPSKRTQEKSKMNARLFVGNLSFDTNELELRDRPVQALAAPTLLALAVLGQHRQ